MRILLLLAATATATAAHAAGPASAPVFDPVLVPRAVCRAPGAPVVETDPEKMALSPPAPDSTSAVVATCAKLSRQTRKALAKALGKATAEIGSPAREAEPLERPVEEVGRCLPAGQGAWMIVADPARKQFDSEAGEKAWTSRWTVVYVTPEGKAVRSKETGKILFAAQPGMGPRVYWTADVDGDGRGELALAQLFDYGEEEADPDQRVLTAAGGKVSRVQRLQGHHPETMVDVDRDGRVDLLAGSAYAFPFAGLNEDSKDGPSELDHGQPDGTWKRDAVSAEFIRAGCEGYVMAPPYLPKPGSAEPRNLEDLAPIFACLRHAGVPGEAIEAQVRKELKAAGSEDLGGYPGFEEQMAELRTAPPWTFPPCTAGSPP